MSKQTITVDGKKYDAEALSKAARQQLLNLQVADQEIARLKAQLAMAQTARIAYGQSLKAELEKAPAA